MMRYKIIFFLTIFCLFGYIDVLADVKFLNSPEAKEFADMMIAKHGFTANEMDDILSEAKYLQTPAKSSDSPAEALDWLTYSTRMITNVKIKHGIEYYKKHRLDLRKAQSIYGVPNYIIAGILGIETNYGKFPLKYRAADALASLAFFYPRRAKYFQDEFKALLIYAKKHQVNPFSFLSSYAGAVGIPQFMPSNIAKFAVDADLNGKADIVRSHKDAIYSVGNFLKANKWQKGKPIVTEVKLKTNSDFRSLLKENPCSKGAMTTTVGELQKAGVVFPIKVASKTKAAIFALDTPDGEKYHVGFPNLCVIYKYNPSLRYAMVINSLGSKLGGEKSTSTSKKKTKKK